MNLDNLAKRNIRPLLKAKKLSFPGWYTIRRSFGTEVRLHTGQRRRTNWTRLKDRPWFKLPFAQNLHPTV